MRVTIVGDLKIKEENDGVTFSWQGLEYSELPVTQHRISQIQTVFQKFKPDDPLLAIDFALDDQGEFADNAYNFLEAWREGEYWPDYIVWIKVKFLKGLQSAAA